MHSCEDTKEQLQALCFSLGVGSGDDSTSVEELIRRVEWGFDFCINATIDRCINIVKSNPDNYEQYLNNIKINRTKNDFE